MSEIYNFEQTYKPYDINLLFVAEAPGKPGQHFYLANTNLFRTIRVSFEQTYGKFDSAEDFLNLFKSTGCYLDHLSQVMIDRTDKEKRKSAREEGIRSLSERLKLYQPKVIVILMKDIEKQVNRAIQLSGIHSVRILAVAPYPAGSETNRKNCIKTIHGILVAYNEKIGK